MARPRSPRRLDEIVEAALVVFERKGFLRARVADVAREAGVSPGLIYTYAESKEALFHLVLLRELGGELDNSELPIPNPTGATTEAMATQALAEVATIPSLNEALARAKPADDDVAAELSGIVADHYDRIHRFRRFIRVAEKSAQDWPEMAETIFAEHRRPYVSNLASYIAARVSTGHFRPVPDPDVAARFIVETVAWFAMHRYGDFDGALIDDDDAHSTVVQMITNALVPAPPEKRSRR